MSRWLAIGALGLGALTACIVSIDESKLNAQPNRVGGDDDDDNAPVKKDAGKIADAAVKDALVEAPPVEAGTTLPTSCQDALNDDPTAPTGATTIAFQNQALTVFCEQGAGGGWTLLHRLSAGPGITGDPMTFYNSFGLHDTELAEITPTHTSTHYTSRLLSHWNVDFPVKEAMVRVYDATGNSLKELVFDAGPLAAAPASTYTTFFLPERLLSSSWSDLSKNGSFSDFTVQGSNDIVRRFNVNRKYSTCETDVGWLVAHGSAATVACPGYEQPSDHIRIYFAPGTTGQHWLDSVSDASSLAVFAR